MEVSEIHITLDFPRGSVQINPLYIENIVKFKIYLIHLTYQPSQLSLAYFTWLRPLTLDTVGQNHLTQSLFYNELLTVSYNVLDTVLKVNNRKGVVVKHRGCLHS